MSHPKIIIGGTDPDTRKRYQDQTAEKTERYIAERQALARAAFDALWADREAQGKRLHDGEGVWNAALDPLTPTERGIVVIQFKDCLRKAAKYEVKAEPMQVIPVAEDPHGP